MRITPNDTLALLIDIQSKIFPVMANHEELEKNSLTLVHGLKTLNIPILITEQYTRGLGYTIESIKSALAEDYLPMEKTSFSCCDDSNFMEKLKSMNKKNVIIFGIESHVCVLQTCLDLLAIGFQPIVIEDCVSSRSLGNKKVAIERLRQEGAIISTYESILFELLRHSGTEQFKAISRIVK